MKNMVAYAPGKYTLLDHFPNTIYRQLTQSITPVHHSSRILSATSVHSHPAPKTHNAASNLLYFLVPPVPPSLSPSKLPAEPTTPTKPLHTRQLTRKSHRSHPC